MAATQQILRQPETLARTKQNICESRNKVHDCPTIPKLLTNKLSSWIVKVKVKITAPNKSHGVVLFSKTSGVMSLELTDRLEGCTSPQSPKSH